MDIPKGTDIHFYCAQCSHLYFVHFVVYSRCGVLGDWKYDPGLDDGMIDGWVGWSKMESFGLFMLVAVLCYIPLAFR